MIFHTQKSAQLSASHGLILFLNSRVWFAILLTNRKEVCHTISSSYRKHLKHVECQSFAHEQRILGFRVSQKEEFEELKYGHVEILMMIVH